MTQSFEHYRNAYSYPTLTIKGSPNYWEQIEFNNTQNLDNYLNKMLNSNQDEEVVLGYLGVLFWGHASSSDGRNLSRRALGKVKLAYNGYIRRRNQIDEKILGIVNIGIGDVAKIIRKAADFIQMDAYSLALKNLCDLPQLQVAFSSKLCAFISPEKCGVIDSQIANNFPEMEFRLQNGYVANNRDNINRFSNYCIWLQEKSKQLNSDQSNSLWTDRDGTQCRWRALDVERALFS